MFSCDACGSCCRNLDKSDIYSYLDRGDGTCKYLSGNQCSIYDERPIICKVDECYDLFFADDMEKEEYYRLNKLVCVELKKEEDG